MIVYRDAAREADPRAELTALAGLDDPTELLIGFGALEAGLADALLPERDASHPVLAAAGRLALATGRRFAGQQAAPLAPALRALAQDPGLPPRVTIKVAEGYAWYALQPAQYVAAGRELARLAQGGPVTVIGLRSIGTSLSALVAAGLEGHAVERWTLRPRGHPFDRRPVLAPALAARLAGRPGLFVVVDEGPGLSGSSLAGTAEVLGGLGIPDERIVLVPAWRPDPSTMRSELARARWPRHRVICPNIDAGPHGRDLSGGQWRDLLRPEPRPPVQPQHERRKVLAEGRLHRFAGLGPYGRPLQARAQELHAAGFGPRPHGLEDGYLALDWIEGCPLGDLRPHAGQVAAYLVHLGRQPVAGPVEPERLQAMIEANLGTAPPLAPWRGLLASAGAVAIDGRLMPHEWLETPAGLVKTDALDHHADHFFPGLQDPAWDIAGAAVETGIDAGWLAGRLASGLGEPALPRRLPYYLLAYASFRLGYARLCAQSLPIGPDRAGFARLAVRYRKAARVALAGLPARP